MSNDRSHTDKLINALILGAAIVAIFGLFTIAAFEHGTTIGTVAGSAAVILSLALVAVHL